MTGGITEGIRFAIRGGNFWTGDGATYDFLASCSAKPTIDVGENMEYSTKYAKNFSNKNFGPIDNLDNLYADGSVPPNKGYMRRGDLVYNKKMQQTGFFIQNPLPW